MSRQQMVDVLESLINRCEKMSLKFEEGTSSATLLKNRIKALKIALSLLEGESGKYRDDELKKALPPILSIIHKNEKILVRYEAGSSVFRRIDPIVQTMKHAQKLIENEMKKMNE